MVVGSPLFYEHVGASRYATTLTLPTLGDFTLGLYLDGNHTGSDMRFT